MRDNQITALNQCRQHMATLKPLPRHQPAIQAAQNMGMITRTTGRMVTAAGIIMNTTGSPLEDLTTGGNRQHTTMTGIIPRSIRHTITRRLYTMTGILIRGGTAIDTAWAARRTIQAATIGAIAAALASDIHRDLEELRGQRYPSLATIAQIAVIAPGLLWPLRQPSLFYLSDPIPEPKNP